VLIESSNKNAQINSTRNFINQKIWLLLVPFGVIVSLILFFSLRQTEPINIENSSIDILSLKKVTTETGAELTPDFSPDDTEIIYIKTTGKSNTELFIKNISSDKSRLLKTVEGFKTFPKYSPNGKHIVFYVRKGSSTSIYTVSIEGGKPQKLLELKGKVPKGLDWSPNGESIVYTDLLGNSNTYSLHLLNIASRSTIQISFPNENTLGDETPSFSPDGLKIGFKRRKTQETENFGVIKLNTSDKKVKETEIYRNIEFNRSHGFSWNSENSIIYFTSSEGSQVLKMRNLDSEITTTIFNTSSSLALSPLISNDGKSIVFSQWNTIQNIFEADLINSKIVNNRPLIESSRNDLRPQFSPDGSRILFSSNRSGHYNLWTSDSNGENLFQLTYLKQFYEFNGKWSPDGKSIVYAVNENEKKPIYLINAEGGLSTRIIDNGLNPIFSQDGSQIYYFDNEDFNSIKGFDIKKKTKIDFQKNDIKGYQFIQKGQNSYYVKENISGIWKKTPGEKEEKIIENYTDWGTFNWDITSDGIYYTPVRIGQISSLFFYSFSTQVSVDLGELSNALIFINGISVNKNKLLYTLLDGSQSDIQILQFKNSIR